MDAEQAVGSRHIVSPFSTSDKLLNSGIGIAASFGVDWFASKVMAEEIEAYAGMKWADNRYDRLAGSRPNRYGKPVKGKVSSGSAAARRAMQSQYGKHVGGSHWLRNKLRGSNVTDPNWFTKVQQFFIKSPEEVARIKAGRKVANMIAGGDIAAPEGLKSMVRMGRAAHGLGVAMFAVGLANVGYEIGSSLTSAIHERGIQGRRLSRNAMSTQNFADSRMAYTSRQRALQAIQMSQGGVRRALGNEASYLHTTR